MWLGLNRKWWIVIAAAVIIFLIIILTTESKFGFGGSESPRGESADPASETDPAAK